jgi:glycosyltransferase involved in cell wall biosynthesis
MLILHLIHERDIERMDKLIIPSCHKTGDLEHKCVLLSRVEPIQRDRSLIWIEFKRSLDAATLRKIGAVFHGLKPDVLHVHGMDLLPLVVSLNWKSSKTVVSVLKPRSSNWLQKTWERLIGQSMRWVDRVGFPNLALEKIYLNAGVPVSKTRLLTDSVIGPKLSRSEDFALWSEKINGKSNKPYFILMTNSTKASGLLKNLFKKNQPSECQVAVDQSEIKGWTKRFPEIEFVPYPKEIFYEVAKNSIGALFFDRSFDVNLVALELLHLGVPLLVAQDSVVSEAVLNGYNGFALNPKRSSDWQKAISQLCQDYAFRERMRKAARSVAAQKYSIVRWTNDAEAIYKELL